MIDGQIAIMVDGETILMWQPFAAADVLRHGGLVGDGIVIRTDGGRASRFREQDFREDPLNAVFFLETSLDLHRWIERGGEMDGFFERTLRRLHPGGLGGVRFLQPGESLKLAGCEASIQGHLGADGRPGDVRSFERLGIRATLGHTHRPMTRDGIYCAGVCNTELAYARGPITGWAVGHVVTYENGVRQHLIFDGRAFHA